MNNAIFKKEEFRWSFRKKGTQVLNICTRLLLLFGFTSFMGISTPALANPTGGTVVGGSATITNTPAELDINQSSQNALINWNSFNIAAGETTRFIQPNTSATAINRVFNSKELSTINGNLLANGHVIIINPNGVLIGKTANIDTAGFIATTANIADSAFSPAAKIGTLNFNQAGNPNASVINQGDITVEGAGLAALVAPNVRNDGVITAKLGKIQLGAADTFGVDLYGDGLLNLAVGQSAALSTTNTGSLVADGGQVLMTAAAASDVVNSVINNTGVIEAIALQNVNGQIVLKAPGATTNVSGTLQAKGGNVETSGEKLNIADGTDVEAANWLLDPTTFTIGHTGDAGTTINDGTLNGNLTNGSNITETATNSITVNSDAVIGSTHSGSTATLTLDATGSGTSSSSTVAINGVINATANQSGDVLNLVVKANGSVTGSGAITTNGGAVTINGASANLTGAISTGAGNVGITASNGSLTTAAITTTDGNITLAATNGSITATGDLAINLANGSGVTDGSVGVLKLTTTGTGDTDIITKNLTVSDGLVGAAGVSTLNVNSAGALTVNGAVLVTNLDNNDPSDYAQSSASLVAKNGVDITGTVKVTAQDTNQNNFDSTANLVVTSTSGSISTGGITVTSDQNETQNGGTNNTSTATAKLTANNGAVTVTSGGIDVNATAENTIADSSGAAEAKANAGLTIKAGGAISLNGAVTSIADVTSAPVLSADGSNATIDIESTGGELYFSQAPVAHAYDSQNTTGAQDTDAYNGLNYTHATNANSSYSTSSTNDVTIPKNTNYNPTTGAFPYTGPGFATTGNKGTTVTVTTTSNTPVASADQSALTLSGQHVIDVTANATKVYGTSDSTAAVTDTAKFNYIDSLNTGFNNAGSAAADVTGTGSISRTVSAVADENVGDHAVTVSGLTANNSTSAGHFTIVTDPSSKLTITQAPLTVTANNGTKTYGDIYTLSDGATAATLINGTVDSIALADTLHSFILNSTGAVATAGVAGSPYNIVPSSAVITGKAGSLGTGNYAITYSNGKLNVLAATLTVTADPKTMTYGASVPALTDTITGFKNSQTLANSGVTGTANLATAATSASNVGDYAITAAQGTLNAANYVFTFVNGNLHISPATLTVTASLSDQTKPYDGTTAATLNSSDYTLTGFVSGQGATVTQTVGAYNSPNVATATTVTASLPAADFTANSGTVLSNYTLPTTVSGKGTITALSVTASIADQTKAYDGTDAAALSSGNYTLNGFISGEGATVNQTAGHYNSPNVASATTVTADLTGDIVANGGTLLSNYVLPTTASGNGAITALNLTASIADQTKAYDGTDAATLGNGDYTLTGFISGEGATVNQTAGHYNSPNVANATTVTADLTGDIVPNGGTLLSNYNLPTTASGNGTITALNLTASIADQTKAYDGTDAATLGNGDYTLTGFISGEGASVTQTAGHYNSPNVASATTVTADLTGDIVANGGTLLSNYNLPTTASGNGAITALNLTASIADQTKTYDGTNTATLGTGDYTLTGFVGSEGATVNQTAGTYNSPNVANATTVTADLTGEVTANGGTLLSNYVVPTTASGKGTISPAALTIEADSQFITQGQTVPGTTLSYSGFVNSEDNTALTTQPTIASSQSGTPPAHDYLGNYTVNGGSSSNYSITRIAGDLIVSSRNHDCDGEDCQSPPPPPPSNTIVLAPNTEIDPLGRPIISVGDHVINYYPPFQSIQTLTLDVDVSIKGGAAPAIGTSLANIEPAAGGDDNGHKKHHHKVAGSTNPNDLSNIEPAAGGNAPKGPAKGNFVCADDFLDGKSCAAQ